MRRAIGLCFCLMVGGTAAVHAAETNEAAATRAAVAHELPGAPDGTYVVLSFDTRFEHQERAQETVTMMLEDGKFRGAGYFIR